MFVVWELTKDDLLRCVTAQEVVSGLNQMYGVDVAEGTVKNFFAKLPDHTFYEEGFHAPGKMIGNTRKRYCLDEDTIILPETAYILLALAKLGKNHRISPQAIDQVIDEMSVFGVSADDVKGRVEEAVRVGYLKPVGASYTVSNRLRSEREFLEGLASKLTKTPHSDATTTPPTKQSKLR
jgi:hypothetical protein